MRLFIAVNFSEGTRGRLIELRDKLRSVSERGNFSLPENLHLTLAFLGECNATQLSSAKEAMDSIKMEPFNFYIDRVGSFRNGIWWAGGEAEPELLRIQRGLTDRLRKAGFVLENRRFSPHITLGREVITNFQPCKTERFGERINKIELMKSERIKGRLTYTPIYKIES